MTTTRLTNDATRATIRTAILANVIGGDAVRRLEELDVYPDGNRTTRRMVLVQALDFDSCVVFAVPASVRAVATILGDAYGSSTQYSIVNVRDLIAWEQERQRYIRRG